MNEEFCMRDAEIEMIEAAYGDNFKLVQSSLHGDAAFDIVIRVGIKLNVTIRFFLALNYPETPLRFRLDGAMTVLQKKYLDDHLQDQLSNDSQIGPMSLCQSASEVIQQWNDEYILLPKDSVFEKTSGVIARYLIYFHHIMSSTKKRLIVEHATELNIGGYSKPGFPGIVIVEGSKENVSEYVRRIQRLRWQQMVVRGESEEEVGNRDFDECRVFRNGFAELKDGSMSDLASLCKEAGMHDLFMTALKKLPS